MHSFITRGNEFDRSLCLMFEGSKAEGSMAWKEDCGCSLGGILKLICSFSNAGVNGLVNSGCCGNDDENLGPGLLKPPLSGDD